MEKSLSNSELHPDFVLSAQKAGRFVVWDWDLASDALVVDRDAAADLGFGPEALPRTGGEWFRMVDPEDLTTLTELIRKAVQNGGEYRAEVRLRLPNSGEIRWAETRGRVARDAAGQPVRVDGVLIDIDERKRAEVAARRQDGYRRQLLELLTRTTTRKEYLDAVVDVLREWSQCRCVGIRVADEEGRAPYVSFVGYSDSFWERENGLSLRTDECVCVRVADGKPTAREASQMTPGGAFSCGDSGGFFYGLAPAERARYRGTCVAEGFTSMAIVPIRREGATVGLIHIADERREAVPPANVLFLEEMAAAIGEAIVRFAIEDRLRVANAALERRAAQLRALTSDSARVEDRDRRRLAQALHDDLQQLLAAARYGLTSLRPHVLADDPSAVLHQVDGLLTQSMDLSRSLAAELSPPILIDRGLAAGLEWLGRWMQETYGLRVELAVAEGAEPPAEDLRLFLFQTVRSLLLNVVDHSGARHAVVAVPGVEGGLVRVTVADDGVGFDPALLLGLAEPKKAGLFHLRERVEFMGGRMDVNSAPGKGTKIMVTVPVMAMKAVMAADEGDRNHADEANGRRRLRTEGIRVLVVDDHAVFRQGLIELLQKERGITVVGQAADGAEAIEETRRLKPEVVIMDISMPRMNGIEATRAIAAEMPEVVIVGLSMHDRADMAEAMRKAGAAAYLAKDSPAEEIIAGIRRHAPGRGES
jgi:PAS domain S-box-containing protein